MCFLFVFHHFLYRTDYNIAETEEQLRKASHGPNECCYTYCQTAADGICTYCNEFLDAKDIEMEAERITKEKGKRLYNITLKAREEKALRVEAKIQQQLAPVATEDVAAGGHLKMSTVAIVVRNDTLAMNVTRLAERLPYYAFCDGVYYYDEDVDDMPTMAYSDNCPALPTVQSRCRIPYWATNYETSGEDWGSYRKHGEAQKLMVWLSSLLCLWSCYTARALRLHRKQEKRPKQNQQQQQQQQPQQISNNSTAFERGIKENRCRNCENREIMLMNVNNYLTKDGRRKSRRARVNVWYDISENRILIICILSGGGGGGNEIDDRGGLLPKARGNEVSRLRGQKEKLMNFRELVRRRQQIDLLYSKNALILLIHYTNRLKSFMQQAQPHRKRKLTHLQGGWYWWARQHACQSQIPRMIKLKMKLMYKRLMMSLAVGRRKLIRIAKKKKKQKQQKKMTETENMKCSNVSISHCSCSLISCSCNDINKKYNNYTIFNNIITNYNNNNNDKYNYKTTTTNIKRNNKNNTNNNKRHVKINYKENMKKLKFNFSTCNFKDTNNNIKNNMNNNNNNIKIYKNYDYYYTNNKVNHNKSNDTNVISKLPQQQQQFSIITKLQCNTTTRKSFTTRSRHCHNRISFNKIGSTTCIQAPKQNSLLSTLSPLRLVSNNNKNKNIMEIHCRHKSPKNIFKTINTTTTTKKHQNPKPFNIMSTHYPISLKLRHQQYQHYYPDDKNFQKISYNSKLNNYRYFYDYNFNINDWWHRHCRWHSSTSSLPVTTSRCSRCAAGQWQQTRQQQRLHVAPTTISESKHSSSNCQITTNNNNSKSSGNSIPQYHSNRQRHHATTNVTIL